MAVCWAQERECKQARLSLPVLSHMFRLVWNNSTSEMRLCTPTRASTLQSWAGGPLRKNLHVSKWPPCWVRAQCRSGRPGVVSSHNLLTSLMTQPMVTTVSKRNSWARGTHKGLSNSPLSLSQFQFQQHESGPGSTCAPTQLPKNS